MHRNILSTTMEGFVTDDPIIEKSRTGKSICRFSLAVNHFSMPDSPPKVSYIDVEAWENLGEIMNEHLSKGKIVVVVGELRQDRWEGKDGRIQSRIKLVANQFRMTK